MTWTLQLETPVFQYRGRVMSQCLHSEVGGLKNRLTNVSHAIIYIDLDYIFAFNRAPFPPVNVLYPAVTLKELLAEAQLFI